MIVSIVRFRSRLSEEAVEAKFEERADAYRKVPGLLDKTYLRFRDSGEFGAIYVWDSEESLERFRASELARTIPDAYQVEGTPRSELADVRFVLRPEATAAPAD